MVVCGFVLFVCFFVAILRPILAYFIELRKMHLRKKLFDARLGTFSTPRVLIFWIYKDAINPRDHWLRGLCVVVKGFPHSNQHGY